MQSDGNLVQFPKDTPNTTPYAYWQTIAFGTGVTLNLDVDGNLYLLNATSFKLQNLTSGVYKTRGTIFMMRIDSVGLFRLYSHSLGNSSTWSVVWNSTDDRCDPMGLCGLNSFCILNDLAPGCRCLPGFASVNQYNRTSGCERNFTAESCKSKGKNYTLEELDNTNWEDVSYSVLSQTSKEDCSQACLVDCNCEAALFKDGVCRKQRLPLKYGRRAGDSYIALIKVEETSESSTDGILPTREGKKQISTNIIIIIIISCLFVSLILVIVAIFGIILHRYHVSAYRRIPYNGNISFCGDIAPRSFSYAELERMTDDQSLPEDQVILEDWVYQCFEGGDLSQLVGIEEVEPKQLERIIKVAVWCILEEPSLRPSMKKVLLMLEGTVDIPTPPNPTSFISAI
ncbi:hypothetical protein QYF36_009123 [Acer negundo]|nr:hypothetical protein QYF36_009123 [Acer negundo]